MGGGKERERRETLSGCLSHVPSGNQTYNLSMCPDWKLNQRPFVCGSSPNRVTLVREKSRGFYEKEKGNNYRTRRKEFLQVQIS